MKNKANSKFTLSAVERANFMLEMYDRKVAGRKRFGANCVKADKLFAGKDLTITQQ